MAKLICRGKLSPAAREIVNALLAQGRLEEAAIVDAANRGREGEVIGSAYVVEEIYDRSLGEYIQVRTPAPPGPGCGEPLDELIDSIPADGKERVVVCPRCQNHITVRRV